MKSTMNISPSPKSRATEPEIIEGSRQDFACKMCGHPTDHVVLNLFGSEDCRIIWCPNGCVTVYADNKEPVLLPTHTNIPCKCPECSNE